VIDNLTFTQAVWLFCPAFVLHLLEEWPRFTGWARLHASARFTQRDYNVIHAAGIGALFHVAASVLTRSYCPGAITPVAIHLPLFAVITALPCRKVS